MDEQMDEQMDEELRAQLKQLVASVQVPPHLARAIRARTPPAW